MDIMGMIEKEASEAVMGLMIVSDEINSVAKELEGEQKKKLQSVLNDIMSVSSRLERLRQWAMPKDFK